MNAHGERPLRVLLIEDNPGDARLIRVMLAEVGGAPIEVVCVERLMAGLERLEAGGTDLVLLDLSLPDSQGLGTFERLHARAPSVPIIVLSGLTDETVALRAVQEGAQDYLVKGQVEGTLLVRAMRYAIERTRSEAERAQLLQREQAARAQAERLAAERAAILRQIVDGVMIADPTGRITFANEAARRLHGMADPSRAADGQSAPFQLLTLDGEPYPPARRPLVRAAVHGETVVNAELRIRAQDGTETVVQSSATPVLAENGTRLGAVVTLHDVTAQRALERQKDEFLSNVSHDLRTPVTAIKASIGVVLANEPAGTPEPIHRMLVNIDLAADRMAQLVADLLELARLQAGRAQLQPAQTDLRALALRVARAIEPLAHGRGQRVEVDVPDEPLPAVVDAGRLERALLNLLSNAHKYGREGGAICLRLWPGADEIRFAVADDGPGVPAAEQERIFERFYRPEIESTRRNQGAGLGLPIARAMVELHGGRLWVESSSGAGATFWIALPTAPVAAAVGGGVSP
jgi:PAS domain S-box-containing protein